MGSITRLQKLFYVIVFFFFWQLGKEFFSAKVKPLPIEENNTFPNNLPIFLLASSFCFLNQGCNTLANILPKLFRAVVDAKIEPINDMLQFHFSLFVELLLLLDVMIIFFDNSIGYIVFFEVENFGADKHHHFTPFPIHLTSFLVVHGWEQNSS